MPPETSPDGSQPLPLTLHTRREFCLRACQAASLLAAGAVLPACGGSPTSPSSAPALSMLSGTVTGNSVSITVDSAGPLASVGGSAQVQTSIGTFLIARTGQNSFTVLTAICTHEACTITGFLNSQYVCPCHGSQFTTSGAVANGPAASALRTFASTFANGVVTFSA